jgi:hypothetical protein
MDEIAKNNEIHPRDTSFQKTFFQMFKKHDFPKT